MTRLLWDASGLAKRYIPEIGSATVASVWVTVPTSQMTSTFPGYAETYSIFLRKRNRGEITAVTFVAATSALRSDLINDPAFTLISVRVTDVLASTSLMDRHNLNSSDAAILAAYLNYARGASEVCVLVAADLRLLRAASAEGLTTLNPEVLAAADVSAFLAAL